MRYQLIWSWRPERMLDKIDMEEFTKDWEGSILYAIKETGN
jgi:hypothetical protein